MNLQVDLRSVEKEIRLISEANWEMEKETIIFFDKLGFGWVLDNLMVKGMRLNHFKEDSTYNKSLIKILENLLENPGM
jgi:hypothetical protein